MVFVSVGAPADLVRVRLDTCVVAVEVVEAFEVTRVPCGLRAVTVAELLTVPASTSAWVIAYGVVVVQVVVAPGASVVTGQVVAPTLASTTASVVSVDVPELRTAKL
ncbi:hypothetical protein GCM10009593_29440 [Microlunatus antarcticus]